MVWHFWIFCIHTTVSATSLLLARLAWLSSRTVLLSVAIMNL